MDEKYLRNIDSITEKEQDLLKFKAVTIIGCGGLGQSLLNLLCRLGILNFTIIDDDIIEESNLNRQIFTNYNNINKNKIDVCDDFLKAVNKDVKIKTICEKFTKDTRPEYFIDSDIIIDCLDNISDRLLLQDFCENLNKPLISAAVEGWIGQISLILPGDKTLSRFYNVDNKVSNVSCLSFTVSLLASLQASETIKYLLNKETNIRNKILFINLLNNDFFFEE